MMNKKHVMYLDNYKHLLWQVAKAIVPKFIHMKKLFLGKKTYNLFYSNLVGSLYPVCTQLISLKCFWTLCINWIHSKCFNNNIKNIHYKHFKHFQHWFNFKKIKRVKLNRCSHCWGMYYYVWTPIWQDVDLFSTYISPSFVI
jgi:hypothetical protein